MCKLDITHGKAFFSEHQKGGTIMKKLLVVLMVLGLFGALPLLASEQGSMKMESSEGVRKFALQAESIQQKIKRLQAEVKKGEKVYSVEDLKKLEDKLKEANKLLEDMSKGGD